VPDTVLSQLTAAAREAGRILLTHYKSPTLNVRRKPDKSEVSDADIASSHYLADALPQILTAPVLCEEAIVPYEVRRHWTEYWLVDPLDGTKDFLAGENDFTVCIALITRGQPRLGVIYAPALDEMYEAESGKGAFLTRSGERTRLQARGGAPWKAARSRFHDAGETSALFDRNGVKSILPMGSALKFGKVADATVNLFVRLRGCHEWDVASGQIVVTEAGGAMKALPGGGTLSYNTPNAMVEPFAALGSEADFSRLRL
jgi:3'(2'), 5'-bisphosphate nucleotidase